MVATAVNDGIKPYRILAKIQNNRLWRSITQVWPDVVNQSQAAKKLNMGISRFGDVINMKSFPGKIEGGVVVKWKPDALRIASFLGEDVGYLFDPAYYGVGKVPRRAELETGIRQMELGAVERFALAPPRTDRQLIEKVLATLTPRQEAVIRLRFGLGLRFGIGGKVPLTCEEVGDKFSISRGRVNQMEIKACCLMCFRGFPKELLLETAQHLEDDERAVFERHIKERFHWYPQSQNYFRYQDDPVDLSEYTIRERASLFDKAAYKVISFIIKSAIGVDE